MIPLVRPADKLGAPVTVQIATEERPAELAVDAPLQERPRSAGEGLLDPHRLDVGVKSVASGRPSSL